MLVRHNGHYINAHADRQRDGLWKTRVSVASVEAPPKCTRLAAYQVFATPEESEEWGVALGKQWLDNGKPPL